MTQIYDVPFINDDLLTTAITPIYGLTKVNKNKIRTDVPSVIISSTALTNPNLLSETLANYLLTQQINGSTPALPNIHESEDSTETTMNNPQTQENSYQQTTKTQENLSLAYEINDVVILSDEAKAMLQKSTLINNKPDENVDVPEEQKDSEQNDDEDLESLIKKNLYDESDS